MFLYKLYLTLEDSNKQLLESADRLEEAALDDDDLADDKEFMQYIKELRINVKQSRKELEDLLYKYE